MSRVKIHERNSEMDLKLIKLWLSENSEEKYRGFSSSLAKDTALPLLGVRLPLLRKKAAELAKADARGFLNACDFSSVEIILLYAYVLGRLRGSVEEALFYVDKALPHIDSWVTCDTLCQSFKQAKKHPETVWAKLIEYTRSQKPFTLRVAVVMMLCHFLTEDYIDGVLDVVDKIRCEDYYYRMGAAWTVATAMAKFPEKTMAYLKVSALDDRTYNKAIQKMLESYRVTDTDKALLRTMKRRGRP